MINECCEFVKLCHIKCSGPVFLRHTVEQFTVSGKVFVNVKAHRMGLTKIYTALLS